MFRLRAPLIFCWWSILIISSMRWTRVSPTETPVEADGSFSSIAGAVPPTPFLSSLFPLDAFLSCYETRPLLSRRNPLSISSPVPVSSRSSPGILSLPHGARPHPHYRPPFSLNDLDALFTTRMVHTIDYKLLKLIPRDGLEWTAHPPIVEAMPAERVMQFFNMGGFTLVVNDMIGRSPGVAAAGRALHAELGALGYLGGGIGANLYVTPAHDIRGSPERCCRGFETHFDWMDVVVLQTSGSKAWAVWRDPLVNLPAGTDAKYKPLENDLAPPHEVITLREGDALYLPRGYLHNASTSPLDESSRSVPSSHVTFGIEHSCVSTTEGAVHRAINMFFDDSGREDDLAVPPGTPCPLPPARTLLHDAAAEAVRRDCGGYGEGRTAAARGRAPPGDAQADACALRRSLTRHARTEDEFRAGVRAVGALADANAALRFHAEMAGANQHDEGQQQMDMRHTFCYPKMNVLEYGNACVPVSGGSGPERRRWRQFEKSFKEIVGQFVDYALEHTGELLKISEEDTLRHAEEQFETERSKLVRNGMRTV